MGKLLVCSWVGDYWLFEDDNTLQKVKREVEKNKELYRRIKAVYKDINYYDSDFEKLYPPARKELVEYKKKHKLKRYEKDYVNWVIKDCDRAFKKKLWNY